MKHNTKGVEKLPLQTLVQQCDVDIFMFPGTTAYDTLLNFRKVHCKARGNLLKFSSVKISSIPSLVHTHITFLTANRTRI